MSSDERAPLVFIDTETTGVHPGREVWEVGMIRRDEHGEQEESFFVHVDLSQADPFGLKVGRFYDRHPLGRMLSGVGSDEDSEQPIVGSARAAESVALWTHGAHLVGAVPSFDAATLDPLLRSHGYLPAWHYHLIDVEALAVGYLNGILTRQNELADSGVAVPRWDESNVGLTALPWKSDDLSRACGVEPASDEERHTALGDARWAMRLYDAIVGAS